ncbi:MAG: CcoQ/FixQ family Cbb3-type cytochrome c oxidase assembly chaperone [SAR324 cluster bacterium]|nr:CcoQ/FixQ family Cbb3-type cytochrome c oxidase assembly chaperone [SAR324 cluster bacterium]MBL7034799.1 CcoQ/FixQ family Cbb3-type cytochrome c oxidase assembly chaperone [SAR324 cluster bacterium]
MNWQQWLFVVMTVFMGISLYGFLWYMYSSKDRGERIEKRGKIIFSDTPLEPRDSLL